MSLAKKGATLAVFTVNYRYGPLKGCVTASLSPVGSSYTTVLQTGVA